MTASPQESPDFNLLEKAIDKQRLAIARLMMASPAWKTATWNAKNTARPLINAAFYPSPLPRAQDRKFPLEFAAKSMSL